MLLTANEIAGVAFVLSLVAASKHGSDMLTKASTRIENAAKRGERVNAVIDDDGNQLEELDVGDGGEEEVIYADSLYQPKNMLEMPELFGIREATHFNCRMTKKILRCNKQSES